MVVAAAAEGLRCHGRLALTLRSARTGRVVARRRVNNLIVTTGIAFLAQALNYGLVVSQNAGWGSPYTAPGATWGAVGTSNTAAAAGQTALVAEVGRAIVSNSAVSAGLIIYDFFFPTSLGNGVLNEVGVLGTANLLAPTLTSALNAGSVYTALAVGGLVGTIPNASTLTLGYGTGTTQTVTTTAQVVAGATSIPVTSFTAGNSFAAGSLAAYTPGTLIDRAVLGAPVTKTSAQTMTLELQLTLVSG